MNKTVIKINGVSSESIGLLVSNINSPLPPKIEDRVEIQGINGTTKIGEKWGDRTLTLNCIVADKNINKKLRDVANWVKPKREVCIVSNQDDLIFYIGTINNITNITKQTIKSATFEINFLCEAEIYYVYNKADADLINSPSDLRALDPIKYKRDIIV